jgi:hypothetical protein
VVQDAVAEQQDAARKLISLHFVDFQLSKRLVEFLSMGFKGTF